MKRRFTRQRYLIGLTVVALAAACFQVGTVWLQPAKALARIGASDLSVWRSNFGVTPGETARITVTNLAVTRGLGPINFRCMFLDQDGTLILESDRTGVAAGQFRGRDFPYGGLGVDGEPVTGRKQLRMEVVIEGPRGTSASETLVTVEVLGPEGHTAFETHITQYAINGNSL